MRILFLESFYGGSHRDVADAIIESSRNEIVLRTLPARFWKWRMRGAALTFARQFDEDASYDLIVCGGLMSVADLRALVPPSARSIPTLLYAHETQIVYPSLVEREADLHFAFTDLSNMLAADHVAFNSNTHRRAFLEALPRFLRRLPEHRPMWSVDEVRQRSSVCEPGIRWSQADGVLAGEAPRPSDPPLVLWNHRWEFDKNPEVFFDALREVKAHGVRFRLALLGENFQVVPKPFEAARREFADEMVHYGYVSDRHEYERWLARSSVVVSTAIQENFGISVLEAIAHGAAPLLPRRLSYPEIIPAEHHDVLYDEGELPARLEATLRDPIPPDPALVRHARSFAWERRITAFDELFERVAGGADDQTRA